MKKNETNSSGVRTKADAGNQNGNQEVPQQPDTSVNDSGMVSRETTATKKIEVQAVSIVDFYGDEKLAIIIKGENKEENVIIQVGEKNWDKVAKIINRQN